jgi:ribosomal protein S18 acetylase RimI-like enzyme
MTIDIRPYSSQADEGNLFAMIKAEGPEWKGHYGEQYRKALANSIVFVAYNNDELCGFIRIKNDDGFGVYIYDLLVAPKSRGKSIGRALMEKVCTEFPNDTVYVMSDVDEYYSKQGYKRIGSIFEVCVRER